MKDPATKKALVWGWLLLAFSLPFGLTLETLHAFKVAGYLESAMRREMWTLAHAHGNLVGILLLAFAGLGERALPNAAARTKVSLLLRLGALLLPLGFLLGGILNAEGDPSLGIALVPIGALLLLVGLVLAAIGARSTGADD